MPLRSFGKQHLEDVVPVVNTAESVANWCAVDTRTGRLTVMLEENYCFDAEVYADDTEVVQPMDFREDQRSGSKTPFLCNESVGLTMKCAVNLGKWIMRNLFTALIEEEIRRDESYRKELLAKRQQSKGLQRGNAPLSISMPVSELTSGDSESTPRPLGGSYLVPNTPGLSIGVATPILPANVATLLPIQLSPTAEEDRGSEQDATTTEHSSAGGTRPDDYFSPNPTAQPSGASSGSNQKVPSTPIEKGADTTPSSPVDDKDEKKKGLLFGKGKKFQMNFPTMKLSRISSESKPVAAAPEEKSEDASDKSSEREELTFEDNLLGVIQKIRHEYDEQLQTNPDQPLVMGVTPSLPDETPPLRQPPHTLVLIQEDNPEAGGVVDLYGGAIANLGADADVLERIAPAWLGDLLIRVCFLIPRVKIRGRSLSLFLG
jgi:WD repeat-containing protein 48